MKAKTSTSAITDIGPGDPVTEAAGVLATTEGALATVNVRIDGGNPDVTADDLLRAEAEARIARGCLAVAEHQAAARAEQWRQDRLRAIKAEVVTTIDPATLNDARAKLEAGLTAWVDVCAAYKARRTALWDELSRLGQSPDTSTPVGRPAPMQSAIKAVATEAIRRHFPRNEVNLNSPPA